MLESQQELSEEEKNKIINKCTENLLAEIDIEVRITLQKREKKTPTFGLEKPKRKEAKVKKEKRIIHVM